MSEEPKTVRSACLNYLDYATIHGLGRFKNTPYVVLKVIWLLLILVSFGMIGLQVSRLVQKWRSYPISTSVEIKSGAQMEFPGVTVCNRNPLKYSKVKRQRDLMEVIMAMAQFWNIPLDTFETSGVYKGPKYNVTGSFSGVDANENFLLRLSATSNEKVQNMSQTKEEFIVSCFYAGRPCFAENFTRYRTYEYGICYTFPHPEDINKFLVEAAGPAYGLELILDVDQDEYLPFVTEAAGVVVAIHDLNYLPYAYEEGLMIPTGFETSIAIDIIKQERIAGVTERCDVENRYDNILQCLRDCLDSDIINDCKCSRRTFGYIDVKGAPTFDYYYYPNYADYDDGKGTNANYYDYDDGNSTGTNASIPPCRTEEHSKCIQNVIKNQLAGKSNCGKKSCIVPCKQTIFEKTVSMSRWPSLRYKPMLDKLVEFYTNKSRKPFTDADTGDNLVSLRVYLSSLSYQSVTEDLAYTDENFASDIGGQLGLWAGVSVLSLCELVELCVLLFGFFFKRNKTAVEQSKE